MKKRALAIAGIVLLSIFAVCAVCVLLHFFPVYRIIDIGAVMDYYSSEQIEKALYIGSPSDRREAQAVLRLAEQAFSDTVHTRAENEEAYGLLARYAMSNDYYDDVTSCDFSLELWSSHLGESDGWIWVFYSFEAFNSDGSIACGSWRVPSLWKVEKDDSGNWVVAGIREHP